jgi:undecaprenyl-diphosphatase
MNQIVRSVVLGIVQGLTEFLPISSSFHLRLVPALLGWPKIGLAFSAFLHLGTLLAVVIYFGKDLLQIAQNGYHELLNPTFSFARFTNTLAFKIMLGSVPAVLIGFFFHDQLELLDRNLYVTSVCLIVVGLFLWFCDQSPINKTSLEQIRANESVLVGIGQASALVPGVSRSGATISVGRLLGFNREQAAKFSFLLGVPVIFGAGLLELLKVLKHSAELEVGISACVVGCITSALVGYFAIHFLLKFLQTNSLLPFTIYRLVVGAGSLFLLLKGSIK